MGREPPRPGARPNSKQDRREDADDDSAWGKWLLSIRRPEQPSLGYPRRNPISSALYTTKPFLHPGFTAPTMIGYLPTSYRKPRCRPHQPFVPTATTRLCLVHITRAITSTHCSPRTSLTPSHDIDTSRLALLQSDKQSPELCDDFIEAPDTRLQEATLLHQFAEAAYTGPLLDFGRNPVLFPFLWLYRQGVLSPWTCKRRPILDGDNWWRGHAAAFLKYVNLPPESLRYEAGRLQVSSASGGRRRLESGDRNVGNTERRLESVKFPFIDGRRVRDEEEVEKSEIK
ncbi:hypothetical protein KSP40_PGU012697 [Platanthera guangdongensis]|uniref:Uncharacterized protein n=1 Tax=Platanthera guangdongensis TaxID=2320717 RepID=A0ABR2LHV1_9ASPA